MPKYLTRQSPCLAGNISEHPDDKAWKLDVGAECNMLLELADELERATQGSADEVATVGAIRNLVDRVAQFEELETEPEEEDTEECNGCRQPVERGEPYYSSPCGTYCDDCMEEKHARECAVCRNEFSIKLNTETEEQP